MSLSKHIFDDTPPDFFAVLTLRYGRYYIDALDKIEEVQRMRHGVGLTRDELIQICENVIISIGAVSGVLESSNTEQEADDKLTPAAMLRYMLKCKWLEEPKRSDYQRVYYL